MKKSIYELELDIKNIEEYEIVCYTYAKILDDLLKHYGYNSEIIREKDSASKTPHVYVVASLGRRKIKLDPTIKHDTARVKMNANTYDFRPLEDDPTFEDDLILADDSINQIDKSEYVNNFDAMMNYISSLSAFNLSKVDNRTLIMNKFNAIVSMVNLKKEFKRYDDIDYFLSYLIKRSKINEPNLIVRPAVFFNVDDPTMRDIINIIKVDLDVDESIFYIMEKEDDHYHIRLSSNEEVLEKLEQYSNWIIYEYFRNAAKKRFTIHERYRGSTIIC